MEVAQSYQLDPLNPQIIFILGGPGSGKGTQCERLVRDNHFEHISVGEVIRAVVERGGSEAEVLKSYMEKGELIPDTVVVDSLQEEIKYRKAQKYLIDGFPRNIEQAKLFESQIKEIDLIVNIECAEQTLVERLTKRSKTSNRADDNEETIKNRIRVFYEKTEAVSEYYKKFGKIKRINGDQTVDKVYQDVKKAIKPNLIFFMGPPAVGKTTVAKILSEKLKYLFINLEEFARQYQCNTQSDISNALMTFCASAPHNCIIIDSFFTDHNTAQVFFKHFATPQYVFYLDSPKDEVFMNISAYYKTDKQKKYQQQVYSQYIQDRVGLLKMMKGQSYFKVIQAASSIQNIVNQIFQIHKPLTLVSFDYNNLDLAMDYYQTMEQERGYMYCDMEELIQHEVDRGTHLGRKMGSFVNAGKKVSNQYKVELVQKIMFNEPDNTKFVFSNWPCNNKDFADFERELYPIDYLLNFKHPSIEYNYKHDEDAYLSYYTKGKTIDIDKHAIDILDCYTTPRARYGFVAGPTAGGKTTIAKNIAQKFDYELIDFTNEQFLENVKAKFIKEDDEVQEVGYKHIEQYFVERLDPTTPSKTVIFDSFPYEQNLEAFISKVGLPTFIVNLRVNKEPLIKRYKEKNEMDKEQELGEEDQAKIEEFLKKDQDQTIYWTDLSQNNFGVKLFNVNGDLALESTRRYVNNIFYKRVFIVSDYLDYRQKNEEFYNRSSDEIRSDQRLIFLNVCAIRGITFVDIQSLLQAHYDCEKQKETTIQLQNQYQMRWSKQGPSYPSNYTPQLILTLIQQYLSSLGNETRDVLLYNYPSADAPVDKKQNEFVFPRASDELKLIEDTLGPVRFVGVLTKERMEHIIQDPVWEMEKPVEKPKPKEGEEGEEGENPPEGDGEGDEEEGKPKFNIFDFTWTKSDGLPKTLPQWYNKTRKSIKKHYSLQEGSEYAFDKLNSYLDMIDEENEQNKEEQDFRKVNLFVQLRYDNVEEEHEEDPVEPESEEENPNNDDDDDNNEEGQAEGEQQQQENEEGEQQEDEQEEEQ